MALMESEHPRSRILLIGMGELGHRILTHLLPVPDGPEIYLASRNEDMALRRRNSAVYAARQLGYKTQVPPWIRMDVENVGQAAEVIAHVNPTFVVNATTMQSWWVQELLPPASARRLAEAQVGPWLPVHLWLTTQIVDACILAGRRSQDVINCSFPDVVNPVLAAQDKAPLLGIGNVANNEPSVTQAAAAMLDVDYRRIRVRMIMHHYVSHHISRHGDSGGAPYCLRIAVDGTDVTEGIDTLRLLKDLPDQHRRVGGREGQTVTAASAVRVILGLMSSTPVFAHAPGLLGLPGGYPVKLGLDCVKLDLPEGMSQPEAVAINQRAQRYEGIDEIRADGSVRFAEEQSEVMRRELGYDCDWLTPSEVPARARELVRAYASYRTKATEHSQVHYAPASATVSGL